MEEHRNDDLARRLVEASELRGDFVLSSGKHSTVYFDKFRFLTDPALLKDTAKAVAELLPEGITHLAAPEGAATLQKRAKLFGECVRAEGETSREFYDRLRRWNDRALPQTRSPRHPPRQSG